MKSTEHVVSAANASIDALQLGVGNQEIVFDSLTEVRGLAAAFAGQAQHSLLLHTHNLEPLIFDQQPFLEVVQAMVRKHRHSSFYILLQDGRSAVQDGNRLIELSRRLSSRIQIRRPQAEYSNFGETFLLADNSGYLHRPLYSRYEGTASFNNPARTLRLQQYFNTVWERSQPDSEVRRLHL